jgi:hypothetical protein
VNQTPDHPTPHQAESDSSQSIIRTITAEVLGWNPRQLQQPALAGDFSDMVAVEKGGEAIRYQLLRLEYVLSPNGVLREWLRLVVRAAVLLGIPLLFLLPVLFYFFGSVSALSALFADCIFEVVVAVVPVLAVLIICKAVALILGGRRGSSRKK